MNILLVVLIEIHNCSARLLQHLAQRFRKRIVQIDPIALDDCICPDCFSLVIFDVKGGHADLCRACRTRGCICGGC